MKGEIKMKKRLFGKWKIIFLISIVIVVAIFSTVIIFRIADNSPKKVIDTFFDATKNKNVKKFASVLEPNDYIESVNKLAKENKDAANYYTRAKEALENNWSYYEQRYGFDYVIDKKVYDYKKVDLDRYNKDMKYNRGYNSKFTEGVVYKVILGNDKNGHIKETNYFHILKYKGDWYFRLNDEKFDKSLYGK